MMKGHRSQRVLYRFVYLFLLVITAAFVWPEHRVGGRLGVQVSDPPNRVIWLHYDYMVKEGPHAHSHAPDPQAIQIVVDAFRRHGITLHIDPQHNAIPERKVITLQPVNPACAGTDAVDIHDLRSAYFQPSDNHTWHYAVFGHFTTCPDTSHCQSACPADPLCGGQPDSASTGTAELPGQNFAVAGANLDGRLAQDASTFMHELGHNFGLLHGGSEACINQEPNYISVMNYSYQAVGIPIADAPASSQLKSCETDRDCGRGAACALSDPFNYCFRVDYSDQELPPLNEDSLDENVGVSGSPDDTDIVLYFVPGTDTVELLGPSYGPIDWNNNGDFTETGVKVDINNSGGGPEILTGFNDWAYLQAYLNTPDYRNGVVRQNPAVISCGSSH